MAVAPARGTISGDALKYAGLGYVYGGTGTRPGDWDCSSFVSYVLGHDLGLALPGGGHWNAAGYPPHTHGPVVTDYSSWSGAKPVRSPAAGDLCCWVGSGTGGHIGIAISGTRMISALDSSQGTVITPIRGYGPAGAPLVFRRVTGAPGGAGQPGGAAGPPRSVLGAGALLGAALAGASVGVILLAAVAAGLAGAVLLAAAAGALHSEGATGAQA